MKPLIQRILFPTDFSEPAQQAKKYVAVLANQFGAEIHALHVVGEYLPTPRRDRSSELPEESALARILRVAETELTREMQDCEVQEFRVRYDVRFGSIAQQIVLYADEQQMDLIVICTHGRTGLFHQLIGSVAEKVVRLAKCPVLTVHPQGHQFLLDTQKQSNS